jgi:hypothetical protein
MRWGGVIAAFVIGVLVGLIVCYWNQIKAVYENRNLISSGANLIDAGQDFFSQVRHKL